MMGEQRTSQLGRKLSQLPEVGCQMGAEVEAGSSNIQIVPLRRRYNVKTALVVECSLVLDEVKQLASRHAGVVTASTEDVGPADRGGVTFGPLGRLGVGDHLASHTLSASTPVLQ